MTYLNNLFSLGLSFALNIAIHVITIIILVFYSNFTDKNFDHFNTHISYINSSLLFSLFLGSVAVVFISLLVSPFLHIFSKKISLRISLPAAIAFTILLVVSIFAVADANYLHWKNEIISNCGADGCSDSHSNYLFPGFQFSIYLIIYTLSLVWTSTVIRGTFTDKK